jgi:uncharacterized protein (TIGR00369 family)
MIDAEHHRSLSAFMQPRQSRSGTGTRILISDGQAEVRLPTRSEFHHAAQAVYGSVYFRALDDAAFFAVNSRVREVLVLTVSFTVHFVRPVAIGELRAVGRLLHGGGRLFFAESDLRNDSGELLAHGSGVFTRSAISLDPSIGYA